MQAVVVVDVAQERVALMSGKFEKVHGGKLHAHDARKQCSIFGRKEMSVQRLLRGETAVQHVEIAALLKFLQVGVESQKAREAEQEDDVEVFCFLIFIMPIH